MSRTSRPRPRPLEFAGDHACRRERIVVQGIVQGVGFRPFAYRVATGLGLSGFIANDSNGVIIEVEGASDRLDRFRRTLLTSPPALARIDAHHVQSIPPRHTTAFVIDTSRRGAHASTLIAPDMAVCDNCLRELFDPADRRYRYPFINCTNCGPRYTIVERIPYDRPFTSMKQFAMCPNCAREYNDPCDRRFHAQPVACPACGPQLIAHDGAQILSSDDPVATAIEALASGRIVAMRGLGGFHLAVDARNESAVRELRRRKGRAEKPLAMMARDLECIRRHCSVSDSEASLLTSSTRPIVLLARRADADAIAPSVAYHHRYFGFMLPYTPLHHLLLRGELPVLVMTSGNLSEEPIAIANEEAVERLGGIADLLLLHDRAILQRCDDSIARVVRDRPRLVRRARGYVPEAVYLKRPLDIPILACGGQLKNTIALGRDDKVFLSQHIGDLDNPAALKFFRDSIAHLQTVLEIKPRLIACDLHPEYLATQWAQGQGELPVIAVQHHHAHMVSALAENGLAGPAIGIVLDGTGYGLDGTVWGGEVLIGNCTAFERYAWLKPVPLPGGAAAIEQPWRMAVSYLHYALGKAAADLDLACLTKIKPSEHAIIAQMLARGVNSPLTSSCGRLFDGVAALLDLCRVNQYEAQAAMALEMSAMAGGNGENDKWESVNEGGVRRGALEFDDIISAVVADIRRGEPAARIARRFHIALADLFVGVAVDARDKTRIERVALSGGVFQNALFFELLHDRLEGAGFEVVSHAKVPTNDGGLALGQAVIANARQAARAKVRS